VRSWIEISRSAIRSNFRAVRDSVGPSVEVMPVVKADAYRHGAIEVARILGAEGAQWFAVSNVEEGIALREAGIAARILVMADYMAENRSFFKDFQLTPVIHSLEDAAAAEIPYHLKIDSGMGRLGVRETPDEIAKAVKATQLEGLMTHFASSANYDSAQTDQQIARFESVLRAVGQPRYIHLSSTIPIAYKRTTAWGNLVRPGHAIYGYVSPARGNAPAMELKVRPALTWKATVLSVKDLEAGSQIGYGGIYKTAKPMRIAILAAGYADGIPHRLSNRGKVIANGKPVPILGAVSMDLTTIEAGDLRAGDAVTILGPGNDAQEIARVAGTISYSVLCGISARVKRVYVD
jgi:alanine racemase